jgi:hypothetical protein
VIEHYAYLILHLPWIVYFALGFVTTMGAICAYGTSVCVKLTYYYVSDKIYWRRRHWREARRLYRRKMGW